jgi:hypothetical protein
VLAAVACGAQIKGLIDRREGKMNLFCFASRNLENIRRGVDASKWAVSTVSDSAMKGRITKAARYFKPGSCGLLYCGQTNSFTVPFVAVSAADPESVVRDVWPEPWVLPFSIRPLGGPDRHLRADIARAVWPFLERRRWGIGGVTAAMNITGATVFSPVSIDSGDWDLIVHHLGYDVASNST